MWISLSISSLEPFLQSCIHLLPLRLLQKSTIRYFYLMTVPQTLSFKSKQLHHRRHNLDVENRDNIRTEDEDRHRGLWKYLLPFLHVHHCFPRLVAVINQFLNANAAAERKIQTSYSDNASNWILGKVTMSKRSGSLSNVGIF